MVHDIDERQLLAQVQREPSGRGRAVLANDYWPRPLPEGVHISSHTLITYDGEVTRGTLYRPVNASGTVFCLMHPRQDLRQHPIIPDILAAGDSVWAQAGREVGNDLRLVHENALLDVAAGLEWLQHTYSHVVLIGHSGGAGLYSFYTEQAQTEPGARIANTPGGAPTKLREAPMPVPDALSLIAPHPGQGKLLLAAIDPSVTDESDPLSVDPELDPFDPRNGFGTAEDGGSHYAEGFVTAYRAAQAQRVARIDERARELIDRQMSARKKVKSGTGTREDGRQSILTPIITTYRTDADLRCTDLQLDPSERPYGSVISAKPSVSNYGVTGFGRLATPEAWLSTWSGLSSNASLNRSLAGITVPTLIIEYTGDASVFHADVAAAVKVAASDDVTHHHIRADHFGRPLARGDEPGTSLAAHTITEWSKERIKP
ncbi:alpha/beta hydrolase [Mycobacterium sp. RTGN6]|uniref:alpha/beta hydrolase n=1 Tax=Mycobacterium sp. RTGN6 TaxID=3016521 RepID=UPI0029C6B9CB|nr:alpha/beta hydrolase [Mycobacterium sp. RTGN6]